MRSMVMDMRMWVLTVMTIALLGLIGCGQDRQVAMDAHNQANTTDDQTFYGAVAVADAGQYATAGRRLKAGESPTDVLASYRQANYTLRELTKVHERNKLRRAVEAIYIDSQKSIFDVLAQDYQRATDATNTSTTAQASSTTSQ